MTELLLSDAFTLPTRPEPALPLWRRAFAAVIVRRQRQADHRISRWLRDRGPRQDAGFRLELERRLMGQ